MNLQTFSEGDNKIEWRLKNSNATLFSGLLDFYGISTLLKIVQRTIF